MKDDKYFFNYDLQPGKKIKNVEYNKKNFAPKVSIITSFYNSHQFMEQTAQCVFNQSFPYWEWIIVDDGSTDPVSIEYLAQLKQKDTRIKIFSKKNEGLAKGRDYAITKCTTEYVIPLDADDLIEETYIEILYWTIKTNSDASWAFTNSVGFGKYMYLSDCKFDSDIMKVNNQITVTSLIKKNIIEQLGGYGKASRYVNEDWHLWLRMLAAEYFPIQVDCYGFWYRRREKSLLSEINDEKKKENQLRLKELKIEADKIKKKVNAIIFPRKLDTKLVYNELPWEYEKCKKESVLYIIPNTCIDRGILRCINESSIDKKTIVVSLDNSKKSQYAFRQELEKNALVYNLDTFLDSRYFLGFIEYIIKSKGVKKIFLSHSNYYVDIMEMFKENNHIQYVNFKENKILYILKIAKHKIKHSFLGRCVRKIMNFGGGKT